MIVEKAVTIFILLPCFGTLVKGSLPNITNLTDFNIQNGTLLPGEMISGLELINADMTVAEILSGNVSSFWSPYYRAFLIISMHDTADADDDHLLSEGELTEFIQNRIGSRISEHKAIFNHMDADKNGYVNMTEYEAGTNEDSELLTSWEREILMGHKLNWTEADAYPSDNQLDLKEFQGYIEPMFNEDIRRKEAQKFLVAIGLNQYPDFEQWKEQTDNPEDIPVIEDLFNKFDANLDGILSIEEVQISLNPFHIVHCRGVAKYIITLIDNNNDGKLDLYELLMNMQLIFTTEELYFSNVSVPDDFIIEYDVLIFLGNLIKEGKLMPLND